jgi:hypothetical protein
LALWRFIKLAVAHAHIPRDFWEPRFHSFCRKTPSASRLMICLSLTPGNETPARVPMLHVCASLSYHHRRLLNLSTGASLLQLNWEERVRIRFEQCNPVHNNSMAITRRLNTIKTKAAIKHDPKSLPSTSHPWNLFP